MNNVAVKIGVMRMVNLQMRLCNEKTAPETVYKAYLHVCNAFGRKVP